MAEDHKSVEVMRHSMAHIMAAAIQKLWPKAKFGVGPVVEDGFYYDVDLDQTLTPEDLKKIESEMNKLIKADVKFEKLELAIDEAIKKCEAAGQTYKVDLLKDLKARGTTNMKDLSGEELGVADDAAKVTTVSFYKTGEFEDLCRGPHVESTGKVGAFRLTKVSGAYWRGDQNNPQMQRVYGVGFKTEPELKDYLAMLEEAEKRDHRKLGRELDLFVFSDLVGSGLPLFTPRGTVLRDRLTQFAESLRSASGFERVSIPHITKTDLYKVSGHWDKFGKELFLVESQETSDKFALKPMNCPHHNQIYANRPRSYRDLPIKYFETTTVYRDEKSGELGGLSRVRSITQDDSHAYVRSDQVAEVVADLIKDIKVLYETLGLELRARLSFRDDSDQYLGEKALWQEAEATIRDLAEQNKLESFEAVGEAAFYGPKIDFMGTDAIGREHQVATVQLDFVQPERFELEYTGEDGAMHRPVMIHCAILGSIERFLSVYIEHTAGKFPLWLAPEQVRIATLNDSKKVQDYASQLSGQLKEAGLRATVDDSSESVGKKVRAAELMKVNYVLVIGEREVDSGELSVRERGKSDSTNIKLDDFVARLQEEVKTRAQ